MNAQELQLRKFLIDIGDRLSSDDRDRLTFLLANDVPRRDLDSIAHDNRASMNVIWEALINRQKITPDNVDYLINCFENIHRIDLVRKLKQYSPGSKNETSVGKAKDSPALFFRHEP
jgi:hypothetical protein